MTSDQENKEYKGLQSHLGQDKLRKQLNYCTVVISQWEKKLT